MTTVAFDGTTLAADSQINGSYVEYGNKIEKVGNITIACAGTVSEIALFKRWCRDRTKDKPTLTDFSCLEIRSGKVYYYDENLEPLTPSIPVAIGSGSDFAMGAMLAGATAKEAVKIACKLDSNSGGKIKTVTL